MKILAVDDDQIVLRLLRKILESAGYDTVRTCTSAEEALKLVNNARVPFGCFLVDIQMPGMDGIQFCRTLRETRRHAETPILMLTAMAEKPDIDRAFAAGASDYLTKPLDPTEIMARLGIAEALIKERKSLEESAGVIDSLIEVLDRTTRHDFEEAIDLGKMDRLLRYPAFENYVYQSGRGAMFRSTVFAAKVRNAEDLHRKLPPLEFRDFLRATATTIIQRFKEDDVHIAYRGSGEFSGFVPRRNSHMFQRLSEEVEIAIPESDGKDAAKLPASTQLVFAPGAGIRLPTRGELSRSIWTAVESARVKTAPPVAQGTKWRLTRKPAATAQDASAKTPEAQQELRAEFAQMLRDEVKTDAGDRKKLAPSVFGTTSPRQKEIAPKGAGVRKSVKVRSVETPSTLEKRTRPVTQTPVAPVPRGVDAMPPDAVTAPRRKPEAMAKIETAQDPLVSRPVRMPKPAEATGSDAANETTAPPVHMSVEQALEAAVNKSRGQFVAKLAEYHVKLAQVAKADADQQQSDASIEEAMFIAHRIAGVGKTLGFPELGAVARQTEAALAAYRQELGSPELRKASVTRTDHLARVVEATYASYVKTAN
ncbi:response regulator [Maritimibacter sp. DP1N21-5]|uniref:response regulator n=1 Tax=Maritimibacter sp. DP1N21-5 TaxID=2836867 RepID=UPI001C46D1AB|nr:response regulator [Maritimibacter sp. DP1N21-5]MBV7407486.1 response regulator [Maritimibacter sp. DP1N21-5]